MSQNHGFSMLFFYVVYASQAGVPLDICLGHAKVVLERLQTSKSHLIMVLWTRGSIGTYWESSRCFWNRKIAICCNMFHFQASTPLKTCNLLTLIFLNSLEQLQKDVIWQNSIL